jgi:hypothetical protein
MCWAKISADLSAKITDFFVIFLSVSKYNARRISSNTLQPPPSVSLTTQNCGSSFHFIRCHLNDVDEITSLNILKSTIIVGFIIYCSSSRR